MTDLEALANEFAKRAKYHKEAREVTEGSTSYHHETRAEMFEAFAQLTRLLDRRLPLR